MDKLQFLVLVGSNSLHAVMSTWHWNTVRERRVTTGRWRDYCLGCGVVGQSSEGSGVAGPAIQQSRLVTQPERNPLQALHTTTTPSNIPLFIYFASAAVAVDSSHMTVSSSAWWSRFSPPSNFVNIYIYISFFLQKGSTYIIHTTRPTIKRLKKE